jgi:hypothetical protein
LLWLTVSCHYFLRLIANNTRAPIDAVATNIGAVSGTMNPGLQGDTRMLKNGVHTPDLATAKTSILACLDGSFTVNSRGILPIAFAPRKGPKL